MKITEDSFIFDNEKANEENYHSSSSEFKGEHSVFEHEFTHNTTTLEHSNLDGIIIVDIIA